MTQVFDRWEGTFIEGDWTFCTWSFRGNLMVKITNGNRVIHPLQSRQDRWVKHLHSDESPLELLEELGLNANE